MDIHLLTPFGLIDITLYIAAKGENKSLSSRTEMDHGTTFPISDAITCEAFKESLRGCVGEILQRHCVGLIDEPHMHLKVDTVGMPLAWQC